jgi:hypothetical protein
MITAKQILETHEGAFTSKHTGVYVDVYWNPTSSDWKELRWEEIRFTADPRSQSIYVWKAGDALHDEVYENLGVSGSVIGLLEKRGNLYYPVESDAGKKLIEKDDDEILYWDWSWTRKYRIDFETVISPYRERFGISKGEVHK